MYTGNCLPTSTAENSPHKPYAAILLETSQLNDAINHRGKEGWPKTGGLLSMGEVYEQTTIHKFSKVEVKNS
jgi:hypothetical protein